MTGRHTCPLGQREWHEQAASIAYQPPPPPPQWAATPAPAAQPSPFIKNPALVKDEQ